MKAELTYQDVNGTIRKSSLFDYDIGTKELLAKERYGTFEFYLKNILQYQVCRLIFLH